MSFDSITISALTYEFALALIDARINKIVQLPNDELLITFKGFKDGEKINKKLLLSASASLQTAYFTTENVSAPITAPAFSMFLRKHLSNARVLDIVQPDFERIINFKLECTNEIGDVSIKYLVVELMGKYSNIILLDDDYMIMDSIKRIGNNISSVREVLPQKHYFIPSQNRFNPLNLDNLSNFQYVLRDYMNVSIFKAMLQAFTGMYPALVTKILDKSNVDYDNKLVNELTDNELDNIFSILKAIITTIKRHKYEYFIYYKNNAPIDYSIIPILSNSDYDKKEFSSLSTLLESYYKEKLICDRLHQQSSSLRQIVNTHLQRSVKKLDAQNKQLKTTTKKDKFKVYGELINVYGYNIPPNSKELVCPNYYDDNKDITIPLDTSISISDNSKHYFDKYNKLKRTEQALLTLIPETENQIEYLSNVLHFIDMARSDEEIIAIKNELADNKIIKKSITKGKKEHKADKLPPLHFISSDGFHIYVGRNSVNNEYLSFKLAKAQDFWFHAKQIHGSHVLLAVNNTKVDEIPDRAFEEAAALAAYYSEAQKSPKVEVDYVRAKELVKPPKSPIGFVIYHTNYSMNIAPSNNLEEVK